MTQITRCPRCQKQLPDDSTSCPACGASFDESPTRRLDAPKTPRTGQNSTSYDSIDDARFVPGAMVAERYRIVGLLGKGGMGEVYRADDLKLSQPVALKFLPEHLLSDGAALARFHREVRIARQVSHQNVCRVYDIGEVDGRHFLSMEFIKGEELSSLLRRIGRLPSDKATEIVRQLCAGLAAAHNRGVLHRDLKPANVMIDENGNVRLTDFGIAGLVDESRSEEISGTPAYMSPEQLAGRELTIKSDIYSLGLVVYEIFTGKKAFDAPTLPQLLNLRNSDTTPTTPSLLVQNIDPLVERVILRCMEKDPDKRPASALEVAASLPGGDPLAAALAAGETPSPEMVAAAPREGFLKPVVAVSLLAFVLVAAAAVLLLSEKTQLHRRVPLEKSPELLQERARTIVAKLGYTVPFLDSTYGLGSDWEYLRYAETKNPSWLGQLSTSQPASIYFWYRQSPGYLIPSTRLAVRASESDPRENVSGMATVIRDPKGRLVEFHAVPPEIDESTGTPPPPNWSVLFEEAGFNQASFTSQPSKWLPPVNSDSRAAWEGTLPNGLQIPIRIEAAAYAGKPVFFKIIGPWNSRGQMRQPESNSLLGKILVFFFVGATLAFVIIGVLLGRRNLRDGSGDRKGGARLAIYIFLALMIAWVFRARHFGGDDELNLLQLGIYFALLPAVLLWLFYLALEPYVRRWWPHRMVSWSRLLAGDFRDPLIGRDTLIGAVFGMMMMVVLNLWTLTPGWFGHVQAPKPVKLYTMLGLRESFGELFFTGITLIVFLAVSCMFLLLLLHIIFRRRQWLALGVAWLLFTIVAGLGSRPLKISLIYAAVFSALIILAATRFGLLTLTAALFFVSLFGNYPMTTDFSVWYAPSTIFVLSITAAVVAFAFYTSLGGQPVFK
ncbi:MAG: serine/threonine protein kinase, partial [Acidobacteriota bacterium]|nr:serine/threonine protein kinase [Acidobacteriota bacterium]